MLARPAGLAREPMADFLPSARFEGGRQGFIYKAGNHGVGYYRDPQAGSRSEAAGRRPRPGGVDFMERLERVEATDQPCVLATGAFPPQHRHVSNLGGQQAAGSRQPPQQQRQLRAAAAQPEWARVEAEGLTESKISYGAHTLANFRPATGLQDHRNMNTRSQIDFGSGYGGGWHDARSTAGQPRRGGGTPPQEAMKAAGGRSNLAGPSDGYGVRRFTTGNFVLS